MLHGLPVLGDFPQWIVRNHTSYTHFCLKEYINKGLARNQSQIQNESL